MRPAPQPVYEMAGVSSKDMDALFTYDAFAILAWTALERLGSVNRAKLRPLPKTGGLSWVGSCP